MVLRRGNPAVQHHDLDGASDAQHAVVIRPIRARDAGERIRDKIAASKKKGMWMGGNAPLGYDVRERKLVVSEAEASTVRMIFQRYAELGSVALLKAELEHAQSLRASQRPAHSGGRHRRAGARPSARALRVWCGSH